MTWEDMIQLKTNYNFKKGLALLKVASKSFPNGSGIYKFIDFYTNLMNFKHIYWFLNKFTDFYTNLLTFKQIYWFLYKFIYF